MSDGVWVNVGFLSAGSGGFHDIVTLTAPTTVSLVCYNNSLTGTADLGPAVLTAIGVTLP